MATPARKPTATMVSSVTGSLYINAELPEMHRIYRTSETPMKDLEFEKLNPGSEALAKPQARMR
jgi:hypothetical protein